MSRWVTIPLGHMAELPSDYPSSDEISQLLEPIPDGIEDRRRKGWRPASTEELIKVALAEIQNIDRLISSGWQPKIWGAEEKLIEPLLIVYSLAPHLLSDGHIRLLKFLVVKEKFLRICQDLNQQEQDVLRNTIRNPKDLKEVLRLVWPKPRK